MKKLIIILALLSSTGVFLFFSCSTLKKDHRHAVRQFKKLERKADKGGYQECFNIVSLYTCHEPNTRPTKDQQIKLIKYCKKGIALDTNIDEMRLPFFYYHLAEYTQNIKEKYSYYRKAARLNDADAQWISGLYYLEGRGGQTIEDRSGVIKNDSALYWIKQAEINGHAYAANFLGNIYLTGKYIYGDVVKADTLVALYYYKKSCILGSRKEACDSVVSFYKRNKNLKDTSELTIYSELAKHLSQYRGYK